MVEKNSSDEDETFYNRYASAPETRKPARKQSGSGTGTLAPSKLTLHVSNVEYHSPTRTSTPSSPTSARSPESRSSKTAKTGQSRGFAFVQFVSRTDAVWAAGEMHGKILNGRKLSASIASDNGRAAEFIKKREYKDKSPCYECGEEGHLSYEGPKNQLGPRKRPPSKRVRRGGGGSAAARVEEGEGDSGSERFEDDVVDSGADQRLLVGEELEEKKRK